MAWWRARAASATLFTRLLRSPADTSGTTAYRTLLAAVAAGTRPHPSGTTTANQFNYDVNSQVGRCLPLGAMHIGAKIHNIEMYPGQGGKLVRSPGTYATILKEPTSKSCLVRLPSHVEKWIDSKCQATIGTVPTGPNPGNKPRKLYKAGQSWWLGHRPNVRGVAMNPIDHPHGGGEGKGKRRRSVTPWGKPCKGGYKTGPLRRKRFKK